MNLVITPAAIVELHEAVAFYTKRVNAELGRAFVAEFERTANLVLSSPTLSAVFRKNRRKYHLRRFPYTIIYVGFAAFEFKTTVRRPGGAIALLFSMYGSRQQAQRAHDAEQKEASK